MVMIWSLLSWLMTSIIEARVVDFPEPVGPVTRTSPLGRKRMSLHAIGSPICSSVSRLLEIVRRTRAIFPRARNAETRNRALSPNAKPKSTVPSCWSFCWFASLVIDFMRYSVSSGCIGGTSSGVSSPCSRRVGGEKQGRCRSLAPSSRTRSSKSAISSLAIVLYAPRVIGGLHRGGGSRFH